MPPQHVQALLFDLDGTIIDSMPLHGAAWREWHRRHDVPFDASHFFAATAGRTNAEIIGELFPDAGGSQIAALAEEKEHLYREAARHDLALVAGFDALRAAARARGLQIAICTAAPPENIALAFERFALEQRVDAVTSPADGLRGKPHPDIFLQAARILDAPPHACLVFEDAPLGIEAARRAGMPAVALTTTLPARAFDGFDNVIAAVADFVGFDLERAVALQTEDNPHA